MSGRIRITTDGGRSAPSWYTRQARIVGVQMLVLAALEVASWLADAVPLNALTATVAAILATLGCVLVGWPRLFIGRAGARGLQPRIRQAQIDATREHFADDLTMPPSGEASAHGADQSG